MTGASVVLVELQKRDVVHADGSFHLIGVPAGVYTLGVRRVGYRDVILRRAFSRDTVVTIVMQEFTYKTSDVIVQGERQSSTPSVTRDAIVLTPADLDKHRGQTVGEALQTVAGVTLLQTGPSIAKPVIRGLHSQRVVVVNGGVQQEGQQWGAEHAPEIDPFSPNKIEILKGAAGVEYGAGAIGGVVRIEPEPLRFGTPLSGSVIANYFSNNRQPAGSLILDYGKLPVAENAAVRTQVSWRRAGDSHTPLYSLTNTAFSELSASVTAGIRNDDYEAEARYSYFGTELGILRASHIGNYNDMIRAIELGEPLIQREFSYTIAPPKQQIAHHLATVRFSTSTYLGKWDVQYGFQFNDRAEFDAHNTRISDSSFLAQALLRPAMTMKLFTHTLDAKLNHHEVETMSGVVGIQLMQQTNDRSGRVFLIPDFTSVNAGVYAIENLTLEGWAFNAGIRYDVRWQQAFPRLQGTTQTQLREETFASLSGAVGVMKVFGSSSLALNLTSAWRPPSINELFSNDVHHGTAQFEIGNAALSPERNISADMTLNLRGDAAQASVSVYAQRMSGFIYLLPDRTNPTITFRGVFPTMRYVQSNATMAGMELNGEIQLITWLRLQTVASMIRTMNLATREPLIFMPSDRARLTLHAHTEELYGMENPYIEAAVQLVRRQENVPVGIDYTEPPAGYALADLAAGGTIHTLGLELTLNCEVRNLLNQPYRDYLSRYRYFALDVGRNIVFRISFPFGSQHSS